MRAYYGSTLALEDDRNRAMLAVMLAEGLYVHRILDIGVLMSATKGTVNPVTGMVFIDSDGKTITNVYQLCDWIIEKGLRKI